MTIEEYFSDWNKVIDLQGANRILHRLTQSKVPVCPLIKNIFKAFHLCPLSNLRVVIIGQDPYNNLKNGSPVATGIAFANSPDTLEKDYSSSLEILRDSIIDFTVPHRRVTFDASLEKWEAQGVLLLNTALSCEVGKPGSHILLWRPFITSLLTNLSKYHTGIVYLLMGTVAQSLEPYIDKQFNYVVRIRHPSWYARNKTPISSDVWKQINNILISQNGYGIKWYKEY